MVKWHKNKEVDFIPQRYKIVYRLAGDKERILNLNNNYNTLKEAWDAFNKHLLRTGLSFNSVEKVEMRDISYESTLA